MSVDLTQFHQVFIEESIEGLDAMESTLMELDPDSIDDEMINTIFRSAHSIKGGSATFGFSAIADFTHVLETLLDQIRSGTRSMSGADVNLFLKSVDCLRDLLSSIDNGASHFTEEALALKAEFEALLSGETGKKSQVNVPVQNKQNSSDSEIPVSSSEGLETVSWNIRFVPNGNILKTGNDPARIFQSLKDMGEFSVRVVDYEFPDLAEFDPETLYLSWIITLTTDQGKEAILEQFEWVVDDCLIEIERLVGAPEWVIDFCPKPTLFKSGNEPTKLITALADLGVVVSVVADFSMVPILAILDPEECYLSWRITLSGDFTKDEIKEVFEWVEDESVVEIYQIPVPLGTSRDFAEHVSDTEKLASIGNVNLIDGLVASADNSSQTSVLKPKAAKKSVSTESTSIRVGIDKIDTLINMVGELVITQSMLGQLGTDFDPSQMPKLIEGLSQLEQNTRELQESVMRIRMLPISFTFSRFPRMVRDLGQQLNKKIHLEMVGDQTELDKTVMEKIGDPLVHLVRNAIDHGIETPEERLAAGKSGTGNIILNAYHLSGNVVIEIQDDGKGLDREIIVNKAVEKGLLTLADAKLLADEQVFDLIFQPGFSTAAIVSDVSGRGVGMDVVRRNIQALNGVVEIKSQKGKGSTILIRLPLTLAILDGQLVQVGGQVFVFPLVSIVESIQCKTEMVNHIAGGCTVFQLRDEYIPIVHLDETYGCAGISEQKNLDNSLMVVVECEREKFGIVVDELLAQQQVVIKSLEQNYKRVEGVSGATILGDGKVALIIDIPGVVKLAGVKGARKIINEEIQKKKLMEKNVAQAQVSVSVKRLQAL